MSNPTQHNQANPTNPTQPNTRNSTMAKFTKKLQNNTLRLIELEKVQLESYTVNGELQPDATLTNVANVIDSIDFFKKISSKQTNTVKALSDDKVLITDVSVSPDGETINTREVVLSLIGFGSYEFLNAL